MSKKAAKGSKQKQIKNGSQIRIRPQYSASTLNRCQRCVKAFPSTKSLHGHMSRCTGSKRSAPILFMQVNAEQVEPLDLALNDLGLIDIDDAEESYEEGVGNTSGAMVTMHDSRR